MAGTHSIPAANSAIYPLKGGYQPLKGKDWGWEVAQAPVLAATTEVAAAAAMRS